MMADPDRDDFHLERERLWLRGTILLCALTATEQCYAAFSEIHREGEINPYLASTLFTGLVVQYARGFEEVTSPKRRLKGRFQLKWLKETPFDASVHRQMLELRNRQIAHAGHALNDVTLQYLVGTLTGQNDQTGEHFAQEVHFGTQARAALGIGFLKDETVLALRQNLDVLRRFCATALADTLAHHQALTQHLFRVDPEFRGHEREMLGKHDFRIIDGAAHLPGEMLHVTKADQGGPHPLEYVAVRYAAVPEEGTIRLQWMVGPPQTPVGSPFKPPSPHLPPESAEPTP